MAHSKKYYILIKIAKVKKKILSAIMDISGIIDTAGRDINTTATLEDSLAMSCEVKSILTT